MPLSDVLMTTKQAAEFLSVSKSWLEHDRMRQPPKVPFIRIGNSSQLPRYKKSDLEDYLAEYPR